MRLKFLCIIFIIILFTPVIGVKAEKGTSHNCHNLRPEVSANGFYLTLKNKLSREKVLVTCKTALSVTGKKLRIDNNADVINKLIKGDRQVHSLFRYFLSVLIAEDMGNFFDESVRNVWLHGSVGEGLSEKISPASDIDLIIEVPSNLERQKVFFYIKSVNDILTEWFNGIMLSSGIQIPELIETAYHSGIVTTDEIEQRKGIAATVSNLYTPPSLIFSRSQKIPGIHEVTSRHMGLSSQTLTLPAILSAA